MGTVLQIVAFNIPYPPDYGGVIDVFYKIKALAECGVSIHLHCFEYNRPPAQELKRYCTTVTYYRRKKGLARQLSQEPYIVASRADLELLDNLMENPAPILFEGIHSCFFIGNERLQNHQRIVRTHNIEHEYYLNLFRSESNILKKLYYGIEFWKLRNYEVTLRNATEILSISPNDNHYFDQSFGNSHFIPAFHPFDEIKSKEGCGNYILFHGNLSVSENIVAVEYILAHVCSKISHQFIIAGKDPDKRIRRAIENKPNVKLVENPENGTMEQLIGDSQICLIPTFQDTGLKLKLLASLFEGRHCIANKPMIHKTGLEHLCHEANTSGQIVKKINELFFTEFTSEDIAKRKLILEGEFSNRKNAMKIIQLISNEI